jgi:serine/threonine protein phosphatase PrpC
LKFTIYQESRTGRRRNNQDRVAYSYSREALLMVVADGMGGHLHGEVAAQIAVQYITEAFRAEASPKIDDPLLFLSRTLNNAHFAILDYAGDRLLDEAPRTTCVACLVQDAAAHWAHAGDSRLYLLREGRVAAVTRDHSRVQTMVEEGLLTPEQAAAHPSRNRIFSCLGGSHAPLIDFSPRALLKRSDVLVLATDGAWGPLGAQRLLERLPGSDLMRSVPLLLDEAEALSGPACDNLSLIALGWEDPFEGAVSTRTLPLHEITTQMEGFNRAREGGTGDLSDDEIERAIAEIQAAIRKYSK